MFVKICGNTSEEDALLAVAMGADALGFIFAASPRQTTPSRVKEIVKKIPPEILTVGVFRNDPINRIVDTVKRTGVKAIQLHGMEEASDIEELRKKLPLTIIKVFTAGSLQLRTSDECGADIVMLDAPSPGSGQVFDWRLAEGVPDGIRLVLAGGLNPDNVIDAIEAVHPWGVDVATGVEAAPGVKDPRKLRDFIKRAKSTTPIEYQGTGEGPYDWQGEL